MSLLLYYGSGSPYAWRAQLALEHKALPYERNVLSFSDGDTKAPSFRALNPRGKVPVLVDGDFVLYESSAIVEYLDEAYPGRGAPLFPGTARDRALARRLISEVDNYLDKAIDPIAEEAFGRKPEERDPARLADAEARVAAEYGLFTAALRGPFFVGPLSAADFAFFPLVAYLDRCQLRLPGFDAAKLLTPDLAAWKARIEALPYFGKTYPPHWQQKG
jgi:glutathione S-transferase